MDNLDSNLVLELGKAIGRLNETNESVKTLTQDLRKYVESHELVRQACVANNMMSFEKLGKKIDDHVNIDHATNWKYMNALMAIKKHALALIIALLGILFMQFAPPGVIMFIKDTISFIKTLV